MARKIVIDTDSQQPEIEVALITPVFGNTHAPQTFANLLKLYYNLGIELDSNPAARERYASVGRTKTLVAIGEDEPIGGEKHVATYFHGRDGLSNISETHPEFNLPEGQETLVEGGDHPYLEVTSKSAADAMIDLLKAEPEKSVTIVALGPLTNVAWAHRKDPAAFSRVREVVWMGGALDVPGNTSPVAEFNCFADPYAVQALLDGVKEGAFPFTFAPLDITSTHMIPFTDLLYPSLIPGNTLPADYPAPTRLQAFTTAFLLRVRWLQERFGAPDAMEMHDPVAVWYAIAHAGEPAPGWSTKARDFGVERRGEITRGMCVVDRRGTGETSTDRTQDTALTTGNAHLPGKNKATDHADPVPNPANPPAPGASVVPESAPDLEKSPAAPAALPRMISVTPGTDALRKTLLARVFGAAV